MVRRTVPMGTSLRACRRMRRASRESRNFRSFGLRLMKRGYAYLSLSVGMPWQERLKLANAARARNLETRRQDKERAAAQELLQRELDQTR
jgi:hypothetical protein